MRKRLQKTITQNFQRSQQLPRVKQRPRNPSGLSASPPAKPKSSSHLGSGAYRRDNVNRLSAADYFSQSVEPRRCARIFDAPTTAAGSRARYVQFGGKRGNRKVLFIFWFECDSGPGTMVCRELVLVRKSGGFVSRWSRVGLVRGFVGKLGIDVWQLSSRLFNSNLL